MKNAHTLLLLALLMALPLNTFANLTDFQVNDDGLPVTHERPRIAVASDGTFLVAWADLRAGHSDVYVQRYGATGQALGANYRVNADTSETWQGSPAVACGLTNSHSVVWQDYRNGSYPFGADVYLQQFDSALIAIDVNADLTSGLLDSLRENPDIAITPSGTAIVVWAVYRNRNWDIYGQLLASDGTPIGTAFKVNDDLNLAQQHSPRISVFANGSFVVVWYDNRQGNDDIFAQRFDPNGAKIGSNARINSDISITRQAFPDVAADSRGYFTVAWVDWRNGTYPANPDIYSRRFDTLMHALTIDTRVNTDASVRAQRDPAIAADRYGNVAIVWADSTLTSWDITGQLIDADGVVREANFRANYLADSAQLQPDVTLDGRNRYVTWSDKRTGSYQIFASVTKYNEPSLTVEPSSLSFIVNPGGPLPTSQSVVVAHTGYNPLTYQIVSSVGWLQANPASGTTTDTVQVSVSQILAQGSHFGELRVIDLATNDSSLIIPVSVTSSIPQSADSVVLGAVAVRPNQFVNLPIEFRLTSSAKSVMIPLQFDSTLISVSSVQLEAAISARATVATPVTASGKLAVRITANANDSLPAGTYTAASIRFRASNKQGFTLVDSLTIDTMTLRIERTTGSLYNPNFVKGEVMVSITTDADDPTDQPTIPELTLAQNYPNPFNATTEIQFSLPIRTDVRLEIFNILGQHVATLVNRALSAGEHQVAWNGMTDAGHPVPSGIYFYRLDVGDRSLVRKMAVLK